MSPALSPSFRRSVLRRSLIGWSWLLLLAAVGALWWWSAGRPVDLPDAPSARIACVSYAPFRRAGESPLDPHAFISPERIDADLKALSTRVDCVRTYSQGQGLSAVPGIARRYGMKVLMGIWLDADARSNEAQIREGIATAKNYPDVLSGIVVGNEVLLRGELDSTQIAGYLQQVRQAVNVPVTYADVWEFWLRHRELARSVDFITVHILPYWEDHPVAPDKAVRHVAKTYARVQKAFPGRQIMIGETGWPSAGRPRQLASASVVNEARYLRSFLRYADQAHLPYNVIEAFDQPWKRIQEGTAGGYWGIFNARDQPKFPMRGAVVEIPHWWDGWLAGVAAAVLFMLAGWPGRRWRGARGWLALALAGFAAGCALAWQWRQMWFACGDGWQWAQSIVACLLALITALSLARGIAEHLCDVHTSRSFLPRWWRAGWLFALAWYSLLLIFDGRYRDFPLGLFAVPCMGYALHAWLNSDARLTAPLLEERFLAGWLPLLGLLVLMREAWVTPVAWLWLMFCLVLTAAVGLQSWRLYRARLQAQ